MTNEQKIQRVLSEIPNTSRNKAIKIVRFINWCTKWDEKLKKMFASYQRDTKDTNLPEMAFREFIYKNDKSLVKEF